MRRIMGFLSVLVAAFVTMSCSDNGSDPVKYPKKQAAEEPDPAEVDESMPKMGAYKVFNVNVEELSGLCLTTEKDALWAVGDQGVLKKISFDGKATSVWTHDADMEDVTVDPATGNLLIAIEGSQKIYQVDAPSFNTYKTIFYVQEAVDGGYGNSGLEGLSYYKDGMVFVGSQWGANLWVYKLDGTKVSMVSLKKASSEIKEVGGLCYDADRDWLWVVDSEAYKFFIFTPDGKKQLASYSVPFIDNAESICVDHANSCVWIGSDESSPKLYKFSFTNL